MKTIPLLAVSLALAAPGATASPPDDLLPTLDRALAVAKVQSLATAQELADQPGRLPETINRTGELETCGSDWWVSGFFPGVLWYLYECDGGEKLKRQATRFTLRVEDQKHTTDNHDLGFMTARSTSSPTIRKRARLKKRRRPADLCG